MSATCEQTIKSVPTSINDELRRWKIKLTRVPGFINVTERARLHISVFVLFRVLVRNPAPGRSAVACTSFLKGRVERKGILACVLAAKRAL